MEDYECTLDTDDDKIADYKVSKSFIIYYHWGIIIFSIYVYFCILLLYIYLHCIYIYINLRDPSDYVILKLQSSTSYTVQVTNLKRSK